jgi:dTDP-4-amino-4,6-dideoxygalactose transaminase
MIPFVDLRIQYEMLSQEIDEAMQRVCRSASFILGPDVCAFEEEFAAFCGAKYCVGLESGTAALKLALQAFGIGTGDEVIVPANTYIATALAVSQVGASPVLCDVDDSYLIDPAALEGKITSATRAIIPVHLYGQAAALSSILDVARQFGITVIEDAAQAHGAICDGKRVGSVGDVGCFSFYPGKNLGAYGDGGAIVTNNEEIAHNIRLQRDFGQRAKYDHIIKGDNCRLDSIQAAILRVKLPHLDNWNAARRNIAARYDAAFADLDILRPRRDAFGHVYHLYVVEIPNRDGARSLLSSKGIETGIHYPIPIHLQKAFSELNLSEGAFPSVERSAGKLLSLPMFPEMTMTQVQEVIAGVHQHLASSTAA